MSVEAKTGWVLFAFLIGCLVWEVSIPAESYYECETASGQYTMCVKHNK